VGTGWFARARAEFLAKRGIQVGFISRDLERARTAACGGEAFTDLGAGVAWADAVFVATPPGRHAEATLAAARAGRHVLVEKPLCESLARARALRAELGPAAAHVTVAENYRFLPALPLLRSALDAIGPVESVVIVAHRRHPPRGWRLDPELAGGGIGLDIGVHFVHLVRCLVGPFSVDRARVDHRSPEGLDLALALEGRAPSAHVSIDLSWLARDVRSRLTIVGARGSVRTRVGRRWLWRTTRGGFPLWPRFLGWRDRMGQEACVLDWLAAAEQGRAGAVGLDEAIADLEPVFAAYALAAGNMPASAAGGDPPPEAVGRGA
jgi:predicted dehydrogenase